MYHQYEPYDVDKDGGFGQPIDVEAVGITPESAANVWTALVSALLLVLMILGGGIAFYYDYMALGWLSVLVGAAGLARVWTVSVRR